MERSLRCVQMLAKAGAHMDGLEELLEEAAEEERRRHGFLGGLGVPLPVLNYLGVTGRPLEDEDDVNRAHSAVASRVRGLHRSSRAKRRGLFSRSRRWKQYHDAHADIVLKPKKKT